jgi:hypothetical protein
VRPPAVVADSQLMGYRMKCMLVATSQIPHYIGKTNNAVYTDNHTKLTQMAELTVQLLDHAVTALKKI